ncbi:hypothetical protein [Nonomuraea sp. NPDC049400]|uniref:hypothetical protein n=1 Tax=Nonomuraea sp. NPDC049400 TaxID=3364352 RepID=UPI003789F77F
MWEPFTTDVHPTTGKIIECGDRWLDLTRALDILTGIISPATVQAFVDWAEQAGITSEDLDDSVHDLASEPAPDTNNGGLHDQVSFMIESCGEDGARDLLVRCEPEEPRPGHALGTLRCRMADGYDDDRVNDILGRISQATGVRVVCVWNERDRWSCGGESNFYVEGDDGHLRELAGDLWLWLNGRPDDPDTPHFPGLPASWIGPPTGVSAATLAWHDGEHNYARRDLENGE